MSDIEDQAAERVAKAERINAEVVARLSQPTTLGVKESTAKPKRGGKVA